MNWSTAFIPFQLLQEYEQRIDPFPLPRLLLRASIQPCGADSKIVLKNEASYTLYLMIPSPDA